MIIRGSPIHRDGHGECGLFLIRTFLHGLALLAPSPSSFFHPHVSRYLTGIAPITSIAHASPCLTVLSCPEGT